MVQCRACGKQMEEAANFCPYCGTARSLSYQPMPVYASPRKDHGVVIIIVVVVAVIVLPCVLAGFLYLMVMGTGPLHPFVNLDAGSSSNDEIIFNVVSVSNEIELTGVWVNLHTSVEDGGMTASNFPEGSNTSRVGNDRYWLAYNDWDGDRLLSSGDTVTVSSMAGPLPSGPYVLELRNGYQGVVLGVSTYSVP